MEVKKYNYFGSIELGPILDEDKALLQAIIRMTTPKVLVEFGYFYGKSAQAMLDVMRPDAMLYSFDDTKAKIGDDPRLIFTRVSQEKAELPANIDFVFLDASHAFDLNKETFIRMRSLLAEKAIVAVHDTGAWAGGNVFNTDKGKANEKGEWVHCPEEIEFINWLRVDFPEFEQIHLHSGREVRHGITLLQKYATL